MTWPAEERRDDLEPEQPRLEWYVCACDCHADDPHQTPARWLYGYGPEARQALCTDCVLTRLTEHEDVVRTWTHQLRKLWRG
jgi:hypothetical protein